MDGTIDETVASVVDEMVGVVMCEVVDFEVDKVNDIAAEEVVAPAVDGGVDSVVEETVDLAEVAVVSMVGGPVDVAEVDVAELVLDGVLDRVPATVTAVVVVEGLFNLVVGITVLPLECSGTAEMSAEVELAIGVGVRTSTDVERLCTDAEAVDSAGGVEADRVGRFEVVYEVVKVTGMTAPVVRFDTSVGILIPLEPDNEYRVSGTEVDLPATLDEKLISFVDALRVELPP